MSLVLNFVPLTIKTGNLISCGLLSRWSSSPLLKSKRQPKCSTLGAQKTTKMFHSYSTKDNQNGSPGLKTKSLKYGMLCLMLLYSNSQIIPQPVKHGIASITKKIIIITHCRNHRHLFHSKNICPLLFLTFSLPHFASIFFTYLWSFRWPNYIVTLPRYFSFWLQHLNIPTGPPSDELDKNILHFSHWNG